MKWLSFACCILWFIVLGMYIASPDSVHPFTVGSAIFLVGFQFLVDFTKFNLNDKE